MGVHIVRYKELSLHVSLGMLGADYLFYRVDVAYYFQYTASAVITQSNLPTILHMTLR